MRACRCVACCAPLSSFHQVLWGPVLACLRVLCVVALLRSSSFSFSTFSNKDFPSPSHSELSLLGSPRTIANRNYRQGTKVLRFWLTLLILKALREY